jgi:hypothetical protein
MLYHDHPPLGADTYVRSVPMDDRFTAAQYEIGRMFVARLGAEAVGEYFEFDSIDLMWNPLGDPVVAIKGELLIHSTDLLRASLVLLWSVIIEHSEETEEAPSEIVAKLGLALAQNEPPSL